MSTSSAGQPLSRHLVKRPSGPLRAHVERYQAFDAIGWLSEPIRRLEIARAQVVLVIGFGYPLGMRVCGEDLAADGPPSFVTGDDRDLQLDDYQSFLVGPDHAPLLTEHRGLRGCIDISISPWAACELFGGAAGDLGHGPVPLDAVLSGAAGRLQARLAEAGSWQARLVLLETFLRQRVSGARHRVRPEIRWAWDRLEQTAGAIAVTELSRSLGWSHRHFVACFRAQTGLRPKAAARRLRLVRALRLLGRLPHRELGMIAAQCEYADQSHLTRDCRRLAGCTPATYRRLLQAGATTPFLAG